MSNIYVMQRANGDVFALDDHGRFRVPLFNSNATSDETPRLSMSPHSDSNATAVWEDEGGLYSKVA